MGYQNEKTLQQLPTTNLEITQISEAQMAQYAQQFNQIEPSLGDYSAPLVDFSQFELYNILNAAADLAVLALCVSILVLSVPSLKGFLANMLKRFNIGALLSRG